MTATVKELLQAALSMPSKGELVVMPPPSPTLEELTAAIRKGHSEVETALLTAVVRAIETGKSLIAAKKQVGHGNFENYVSIECRFTVRTAQNYMRLAKHEAKVRQLLAHKNEGRSYLTMNEALKFIDGLRKKNSPKQKTMAST
jgi:hypothetical protein